MAAQTLETTDCKDIPLPIVKLNRWTLVLGITLALVIQQPLITTILFAILFPATLFGQRGSLIFQTGKRIFAKQIPGAPLEDRRLQRFNNSIATVLLGGAQIAFIFNAPIVGWVFSIMVAIAAGVALLGFCVGCFLYFQFKINRFRLFGQ